MSPNIISVVLITVLKLPRRYKFDDSTNFNVSNIGNISNIRDFNISIYDNVNIVQVKYITFPPQKQEK